MPPKNDISAKSVNPSAVQLGRTQAMQQICAMLGINGGSTPETIDQFWQELSILLKVANPRSSMVELAKQVFQELGEEWDDDYLEEDGKSLSVEAYETVYSKLNSTRTDQAVPSSFSGDQPDDSEDDDDDDSMGYVPESLSWEAKTLTTKVKYLLRSIEDGSMVLNPAWQRNFVWKLPKQRRLIESILLGLPIPSLLLFTENKTGKTYVIDGRQRLETIDRFVSPKPKKGEEKRRFKTYPAKEPGWGPDEKLNAAANKHFDDLPQEFKTRFESATLVTHEFVDLASDKLYQIFKRYNTGAEKLKAAEIRNAVYQASPLHHMMYRVAGENMTDGAFESADEKRVAHELRSIMRRKVERYGAYDFIGRYFAFSYMTKGSVANATNEFMTRFAGMEVNKLRDEFVRIFDKTLEWYSEHPLCGPDDEKFHAFLATLQMVSTRHMLVRHVDAGHVPESTVIKAIQEHWVPFAQATLMQKQNSTAFWSQQEKWIEQLEHATSPT